MKKLLISLLFSVSVLWAEGTSNIQVIGPFSGLNNTDNPAAIADDKAQDLLNVDLSLGGKSVFKRKGYATALSLDVTTSPVHGTFQFYDSSGNDVVLAFNDTRMTSSVNGGSTTVLFSTGANGSTYQCTDSQGYAYCANTSRTSLIKTDGVTYSLIRSVISTGTMVSVTPDRLVLSGFSDNPNRIDFSAAADFTSWTTGVTPLSAFGFTITAPGPKITHITYAFNRIMWFKSNSFGYILPGQTQSDWVVKTISPNVGTLDNTSVYDKGILYFRGADGNIWSYDGAVLDDLTRDIGGTIDVSQNRVSGSWTQSTLSDWISGSFDSYTYVDTTTVSGNIQTLFPDNFATVRDGSNGTTNLWVANASGTATASISTTALSNYVYSGKLNFSPSTSRYQSVYTSAPVNNLSVGSTFYFDVLTATGGAFNQSVYFMVRDSIATTNTLLTNSNRFYFSFYGDGFNIYPTLAISACGISSASFSGGYSLPTSVSVFLSDTQYQVKIGTTVAISGNNICSMNPSYAYILATSGPSFQSSVTMDNFNVVPQTFTFLSQIKNAANITSWDAFTSNYVDSGGAHTFSIRAASGSFTINSSTPSWTTVLPGAIPNISTGAYFQIKDYFNAYSTSSLPMSLSDFTQYWFEGQALDKSYATYFKEAVWFSVAAGTGSTTNNRILRLDLLNKTWLIYDLPVNGFYIRNNALYFGSSNAGYVFKYGDVDNDNGSAINSYWKSKDFFQASPFTDDDMTDLSVFFKAVDNSTMTMTYAVVGSSESSYQVPMQRSNAAFGKNNRNLPLGTSGNTFNVKFGNNSADQFFEVFSIQYGYNPKSWKPER